MQDYIDFHRHVEMRWSEQEKLDEATRECDARAAKRYNEVLEAARKKAAAVHRRAEMNARAVRRVKEKEMKHAGGELPY